MSLIRGGNYMKKIGKLNEKWFVKHLLMYDPYVAISYCEHRGDCMMSDSSFVKTLNYYIDNGWIEYGTSIRFYWLTEEGVEHIHEIWG